MTDIDLLIFDMGGVLCRDFDIGPEAARLLGIGVEAWRRFVFPDLQDFMRGSLDSSAFWRRFEARSGLKVEGDPWASLFHPRLDGPTEDLIGELRELGGPGGKRPRLVCGTNTIAAHYEIHVALGQYDGFDAVYASHLMDCAKPEPEFWSRILEAEGVAASRAFFVDDYPENVEAAASLGMEARLYVDAEGLRRDLVALGLPLALRRATAEGARSAAG